MINELTSAVTDPEAVAAFFVMLANALQANKDILWDAAKKAYR